MPLTAEAYLDAHGIASDRYEHPAVFTVEEARLHCAHIPGFPCKNLFLRIGTDAYALVILPDNARLDRAKVASLFAGQKTAFASPNELGRILGLTPGAVSLFGLINDGAHRTAVIIHPHVWNAQSVQFHPNANTATLIITHAMLEKFLRSTGHDARVVDVSMES